VIAERMMLNNANRLEERRKVKGAAYYARKKAARRQLAEAQKSAKVNEETKKQLTAFGY
jgi:large subunit ribosomal protein L13Ae